MEVPVSGFKSGGENKGDWQQSYRYSIYICHRVASESGSDIYGDIYIYTKDR